MKKPILSYNLDVQFISAGKAKSISIYLNPSYQIHLKAFFLCKIGKSELEIFFSCAIWRKCEGNSELPNPNLNQISPPLNSAFCRL